MSGHYQIIFTSPELLVDRTSRLRASLLSQELAKSVEFLAVDEAHCIITWGDTFRPAYGKVGDLRAILPFDIPLLAVTATATPLMVQQIKNTLHFHSRNHHINIGNDRPNIEIEVRRMRCTQSSLGDLQYIIDEINVTGVVANRMIFFRECKSTQVAVRHLRKHIPAQFHSKIAYYHARRTPLALQELAERFMKDEVNLLCTTEAAGMVSGFHDSSSIMADDRTGMG